MKEKLIAVVNAMRTWNIGMWVSLTSLAVFSMMASSAIIYIPATLVWIFISGAATYITVKDTLKND